MEKRKNFIAIIILSGLVLFAGSAQEIQPTLPDEFWNSIILLRPGIADLGSLHMIIFKPELRKFKSSTALDGSVSTARFGKMMIEGNAVSLPLEFTRGERVIMRITFHFRYSPGTNTVLFEDFFVENLDEGISGTMSEIDEKAQMIEQYANIVDTGD